MESSLVKHRILRIEGSAEHSRCTRLDIDLHALTMNNFEHRVLRIKPINLCQFRTQGLESTADQRCGRKSTEFASG